MRLWTILRLKTVDLLAMRGLILSLLLLPLLMGMIAGAANLANREPDLRLAIVDEDETDASRELITRLGWHGWQIEETNATQAERLLLRERVDGILTLETGFLQSLTDLSQSHVSFVEMEGSLATALMQEAVAAALLPMHARENMLGRVETRYQQLGQPPPADLKDRFSQAMAEYATAEASLQVHYVGAIETVPTFTFVVSDYSMEIFLISIYAVLGGITLSGNDLRRRLAATRHGLWLDFAATQIALLALGLLQILVYSLAMSHWMQTAWRWQDQFYLAVFLWFMLGFSQILQLIEPSLRLYLSLLILLVLAMAGGCFFQLSETLLRYVGQYTPHGWALSRIRGYAALHPVWPASLAFVFFAFGYGLQKHRAGKPF